MQLVVSQDIDQALDDAMREVEDSVYVVFVEEHPDFPGYLVFQPHEDIRQEFYAAYRDWLSRYLILNELFLLGPFVALLHEHGFRVLFLPSCEPTLADYARWSSPLEIDRFAFTDNRTGERGQLFEYQTFTLNRALERAASDTKSGRFMFFGWGTGSGKGLVAAAGAQAMVNHGHANVVLMFTLRRMKTNSGRVFDNTALSWVVGDGTKDKRRRLYADHGTDVYVNNYDKAKFDYDLLAERIEGKRTLFILDECQKVTSGEGKTQARKALDSLIDKSHSTVWPMTASAVQETPLNYRDIFGLSGGGGVNPLGTKADFKKRYVLHETHKMIPTRSGGRFPITFYDWDRKALHEVRHRVGHCTQSVRKTDPVVRDNFQGLETDVTEIQMSDEDREVYDRIYQLARQAREAEESRLPHLMLMRYVCNTPEALLHSSEPLAAQIAEEMPKLMTSANSAKLEMLCDQLEAIRDAGDKAVVFTHWTNLSLHLIAPHIEARGIKLVRHWGTGMTDKASQEAQDRFKADPAITVFLSSDAGAYGLNLPEARFVFSYECPYSYDDLMQRNARIDRADSHLTGLSAYVMVTNNTVEERIWAENNRRRKVSAATTGTVEELSYDGGGESENDPQTLDHLIFGGEK